MGDLLLGLLIDCICQMTGEALVQLFSFGRVKVTGKNDAPGVGVSARTATTIGVLFWAIVAVMVYCVVLHFRKA